MLPRTLLVVLGLFSGSTAFAADPVEFFETKVRPVLAEHCYSCHGPKKQMAGLRLDTAAGMSKGGDEGPVIAPGKPEHSKLVAAVKRSGEYPMPPTKPLPAEAVGALTEWVRLGAPFPTEKAQQKPTAGAADHWAFKPVREPQVPATRTGPGTANPIDRFILAKLEAQNLTLAPRADKRALIRRAYFDLVGLPPTAAEIEAFVADQSPTAFERVVDRLLASPHYGERWGRHWLDIARYADSKGYVFTEERTYPYAYTYRDYVIQSFNEDKPFDRFVLEQLAADQLDLGADKRPLAAMGFLTVGRRFSNNVHDIIDDRIDVVTRGLLGLTVQCARCHDHKFDPVPMADYYSLYGVFASCNEPKVGPLLVEADAPKVAAFEAELKAKHEAAVAFQRKMYATALAKFRTEESVAAYLEAVRESRRMNSVRADQLAADHSLDANMLGRWREYLADRKRAADPVFAPFLALADLPDDRFAADAPRVLFRVLGPGRKVRVEPKLATALVARKLTSFEDVAAVYGRVLSQSAAAYADGSKPVPASDRLAAALCGPDVPTNPTDEKTADRFVPIVVKREYRKLRNEADAFQAKASNAPPRGMVLVDKPKPTDAVIFLRGNPNNRGPVVPRQFLTAVRRPTDRPFTQGSGRLELAKAIVDPANPLTARVFVNRVWLHHFGQGLVRSPSDFGLRTDPPTHPELLDWLAARFVADGWSVKTLHRRIMLSAAYQQSSDPRPELAADPDNRLLGRMPRRRLDFESLRDGLLAVAGNLDATVYGKSVDLFKEPFTRRRSVYASVDRQNLPGTFRVFDFASPEQHTPQRFVTTVPQQALYLMNSPFVLAQAEGVAARPEVAWAMTAGEKVRRMYRAVLGRNPTADEVRLALTYVRGVDPKAEGKLDRWEQLAQVLLLSNEFAFVD
ncbi:MAG: PSD1 and planctomycete cytochrome C domain-containing protein [Gemmataceae bacterium]